MSQSSMDLKTFITLFHSRKRLIASIVVGSVLLSLAAYRLQEDSFRASLLLSVTRSGWAAETAAQYDQFYRLQADERFADTIVRYLQAPQARNEIISRAGLSSSDRNFLLRGKLKVVRLSSQLITVELKTRTKKAAENVGEAIHETGNRYTENLNRASADSHWFTLERSESIVSSGKFDWRTFLLAGLALGIFVAFWTVLLCHFYSGTQERHEDRD